MPKVSKFGGTSMADATAINRVTDIIKSDDKRKYIVVSAPGKRNKNDIKITDVLLQCANLAASTGNCSELFIKIRERYITIVKDLGLKLNIESYLDIVENGINQTKSSQYAASRGEYLSALIIAEQLDFEFIDAADIVIFDENGVFDAEETNKCAAIRLNQSDRAVIPGFYGASSDGTIRTFSRGGSDVTGSIIARASSAELYENWTDVDGFLTADPRIVENPAIIKQLSYKELRELSYMGASVLHPDSIFPVRISGIPINIRNTFNPKASGTMIVSKEQKADNDKIITGIAGRKDFTIILIDKSMMNSELGFARATLAVFEKFGVSIEHMPSGIDTLSVVVAATDFVSKEREIIAELYKSLMPDSVEVHHGLALIATVGHGMAHKTGTASRLFGALSKAQINIRMIDQGSSELNIIIGVENEDYEKCIIAIYNEFVG